MTAKDSWALLVLLILLFSSLIWVGSWINFIVKARKKQSVDSQAIKRTSIQIGLGAFFSGLLLVIMGLVLQAPPSGGIPILGYVYLFTVCPSLFVLAVLAGFLRAATEIKRKYQMMARPDSEQNLGD
ncbi:MAG TPA: hypothetical protein ENJ31_09480 [Anaerolineae bacterium]|nr:hypothetical protein [Anaerolineae bacterium]